MTIVFLIGLALDMAIFPLGWFVYRQQQEVRVYAKRDDEENGLYFADFGEIFRLRQVIVGHRCCVERGEVSAALVSYTEPVAILKARLSYTSFQVEEDPEGFTN